MKAVAKGGHPAMPSPVRSNLPRHLTTFVGRATELRALKAILASSRMVTLTGTGGSGKSRLAAEVARAGIDQWPDGVWWIELAPLGDPGQVPGAIISALELPGQGLAQDVIAAWLAGKRSLLVLDNCEHLVAACAELCQALLERCPELTIITTSREALGVAGESRYLVPPLGDPDELRLFEERGRLALADFKIESSNLDSVTKICARLDGLPLAIEMAAARVGMMTEPEILSQLDDRFHLLTGSDRTVPRRQQTMAATIDWSHRLLTDDEARLFRRLSVFRGGFTLESARAICADDNDQSVLELLTGLVQKSMVMPERTPGEGTRYRLLESHLAFAEDRLRDSGEVKLIPRRHYEYFRNALAAQDFSWIAPRAANEPASGVADAEWISREWGNLWAALGWARSHADDLGLSLAVDLAESEYGDTTHLRSQLVHLLDHSPAQGLLRVMALRVAAWLAYAQGDYEAALQAATSCVALGREDGDMKEVALGLNLVGMAHQGLKELGAAAQAYAEATSLAEGSGDRRLMAVIRNSVGMLATYRGDYAAARRIGADCLAIARADGNVRLTAACLDSVAWAQVGLEDHVGAAASWKECLSMDHVRNDILSIIGGLEGLSCVATASGDDQRALRLAGAANRRCDEWSVRFEPWMLKHREETRLQSRSRLGARKSDAAWKEGQAMTLDQAVDYALGQSEIENVADAGPLSRREREVAKLVASGMTNRQIADRLFIAERTAEGHVERIRNKLGVRTRTEVATWAVQHGLADVTDTDAKTRGTHIESLTKGRSPCA